MYYGILHALPSTVPSVRFLLRTLPGMLPTRLPESIRGSVQESPVAKSDPSVNAAMPTVQDVTTSRGDGLQLLIVGKDGQYFASHPLPALGQVAIGRADDRDVRIQDPSISRAHAILHIGRELHVEDQGSRHGTRLRGRKLAPGDRIEISIGDAIVMGTATVIVQRRGKNARSWRLWSHSFFEGRLEEECARAERYDRPFALIHALFDSSTPRTEVLAALESATNPGDVIGEYGSRHYELLLVEAERADAEQVIDQLRQRLGTARAGMACHPQDGRDPHTLSQLARSRARGTDETSVAESSGFVTSGDTRMNELRTLVKRIAGSELNILLLGETGVGKEVFARTIHQDSKRSSGPFVAVNCGALPGELIESELFGHKKGSFTGAIQDKTGLLESARGGTVFLDEIGELPLPVQVALLRVLQEREVRRVGDTGYRPIDVRFVCATNRDLEVEIEQGSFRQDLYFRINGFSVIIPPLRERVAEIEPLSRHFVQLACQSQNRLPEPELSPAALNMLTGYHWPGNIRELRNIIERAVVLCAGDAIEPGHLPGDKMQVVALEQTSSNKALTPGSSAAPPVPASSTATNPALNALSSDRQAEIERIKQALDQAAGNQTKAAKLLGVSRRTLINRLDQYGLPRPRKGR